MMGTERVLKTGIWVENKAVEHYGKLLAGAEWDDETRAFIEKDRADEYGHIARWKGFLETRLMEARRGCIDATALHDTLDAANGTLLGCAKATCICARFGSRSRSSRSAIAP